MAEIINLKTEGQKAQTPKEKADFEELMRLIKEGREQDDARLLREKTEAEEKAKRAEQDKARLEELHRKVDQVAGNVAQALGAEGNLFIERKISDFNTDKKIFEGQPTVADNSAEHDASGDAKIFSVQESNRIREELAKMEAEKAGK